MISRLFEELEERIVFLDGPRGTMIQKRNLSEADFRGNRLKDHPYDLKGNNDILNITQQKIISEIYEEYLDAGSDIV